jgi:hypothetical protein
VNQKPSHALDGVGLCGLLVDWHRFRWCPGLDGSWSKASADYVARLMTQAGYKVTIQTYKFDYFAYTAVPVLSEVSQGR